MIVGYVRVSSSWQNPEHQYAELRQAGVENFYEDYMSGKSTERPQYLDVTEFLRGGDTLVVLSLDRLARNLADLLNTVATLARKGVSVRFLTEHLDFDASKDASPTAKLMLSMVGAFAEFERSMIQSRQREGIELAKQRRVYKGRKRTVRDEQIEAVRKMVEMGVPLAAAARKQRLSRTTVYRYMK